MNLALHVVSIVLMLVYVVASYIYTWNKPYNFSILAEIPLWVWITLVAAITTEIIRHYREGRRRA